MLYNYGIVVCGEMQTVFKFKVIYILPAIANNTIVCNVAYGDYASRRLARAV